MPKIDRINDRSKLSTPIEQFIRIYRAERIFIKCAKCGDARLLAVNKKKYWEEFPTVLNQFLLTHSNCEVEYISFQVE